MNRGLFHVLDTPVWVKVPVVLGILSWLGFGHFVGLGLEYPTQKIAI